MILHPDFFAHWKVAKLIELTGDKAAPLMILRLWLYCQEKRAWVFPGFDARSIAHACRASIEPDTLLTFLVECRLIEIHDGTLTVRNWEHHNRLLVSAWANGAMGGRPKPGANRQETSRQPTANRSTRARDSERKIDRAGSRPVISSDAGQEPAGNGPLAGGIREGKLCLVANSETDDADARRREALRKFGGLANAVAQKLNPADT